MQHKVTRAKIFFIILAIALLTLSCGKQKYPKGIYAKISTDKGMVVVFLEFEKVPMTVANFVGLVEGRIKNSALPEGKPYYDGSVFHRVVPNHVIQAGVPKGTDQSGPGYTFPNEIHPELRHSSAGVLGMANAGPHTNGSQFYITLSDRSYLDGDYTVFGHVVQGMDVVKSIVQGDKIESVRIMKIGRKAKEFRVDTDTFNNLVEQAKERVKKDEEKKMKEEAEIIDRNWPGAITSGSGVKYVVVKEGRGKKPQEGDTLKVMYTGKFLDGRMFYSSADEGKPVPDEPAQIFEFKVGKSTVNPGFDEALKDMGEGENRIVIIPSHLA